MLQMSNERIDIAMDAAKSVRVEERLHIECLRIAIENAKLRKALNEYAEGLLQNVLVKNDVVRRDATSGQGNLIQGKKAKAQQNGSFFPVGLFV